MSEEKKDGQEPKKVVVQSPAGSSIKPSALTQITPAAKPPVTPAAPATPPPAAAPADDARRTIKLKPMQKTDGQSEEETVSVDRASVDNAAKPEAAATKPALAGAPADKEDESETVKIEKPTTKPGAVPVKPTVPGAKQTIKLRPSAGTAAAPQAEEAEGTRAGASTIKVKPAGEGDAAAPTVSDGVQQTKKTIRLVAKKPEPASAKPSDPTAKIEGADEDTAALARPSAPTTKLPGGTPEEDLYATAEGEGGGAAAGPAASKKTLKLRTTKLKAPSADATAAAPAAKEGDLSDTDAGSLDAAQESLSAPRMGAGSGADEGNIIFTIAAVVALLLVAYFALMSFGQYSNQYKDGNIPIPGLTK